MVKDGGGAADQAGVGLLVGHGVTHPQATALIDAADGSAGTVLAVFRLLSRTPPTTFAVLTDDRLAAFSRDIATGPTLTVARADISRIVIADSVPGRPRLMVAVDDAPAEEIGELRPDDLAQLASVLVSA